MKRPKSGGSIGNTSTEAGPPSSSHHSHPPINDRIASVIPYYPFKGIDRFYDIQGLLNHPDLFQSTIDVFVERYRGLAIDRIGGFDARGFVLGPPIALALKVPFFMLRKSNKMPNTISTDSTYTKVRSRSRMQK